MYNLPYHNEKEERVIREFIEANPFAFLSGCDADNRPVATQVPVFMNERKGRRLVRGHIMKRSDHYNAFLQNDNVLAVCAGKHTYVSGTWYSNPHTPSTWNYMSVHIRGKIRFLDDSELANILRQTSLHFEAENENSPTVFDNLPGAFKERVMGAIAGFEIEVQEMEAVFKLSQDRDAESYWNIIEKLRQQGESGGVIADEMAKRAKDLFPDRT